MLLAGCGIPHAPSFFLARFQLDHRSRRVRKICTVVFGHRIQLFGCDVHTDCFPRIVPQRFMAPLAPGPTM